VPSVAEIEDNDYEIADEDDDPLDHIPLFFRPVIIDIESKDAFKPQKNVSMPTDMKSTKIASDDKNKTSEFEDTNLLNERILKNLKDLDIIFKSHTLVAKNEKDLQVQKNLTSFIMNQINQMKELEKKKLEEKKSP